MLQFFFPASADWATKARAFCSALFQLHGEKKKKKKERKKNWIWEQMAPPETGWRVWLKLKRYNELCAVFLIELCPGDCYQGTEVRGKQVLCNEELWCLYPGRFPFLFRALWDFGVRYPSHYNVARRILGSSAWSRAVASSKCAQDKMWLHTSTG